MGFESGLIPYPTWRFVYLLFSLGVISSVFAFLQFTTFGMVVRAGMADRETVGLLGILQSFASMNEVKSILPGIDQIIIYLVAVVVLLVRPRGLMGRKGVMES